MTESVLDAVVQMAGGTDLRSGVRMRFGWSMLTLIESGPRQLTVCEPDFDGDPMRDVRPRVDTTLDVMRQQAAVARAVGIDPVDVYFDQFVVVGRGALDAHEIQLFRAEEPSDDDSGWRLTRLGAERSEHDQDYEALRVYTFVRTRPTVLNVLILPPAFAVIMHADRVTTILDSEGRPRLESGRRA